MEVAFIWCSRKGTNWLFTCRKELQPNPKEKITGSSPLPKPTLSLLSLCMCFSVYGSSPGSQVAQLGSFSRSSVSLPERTQCSTAWTVGYIGHLKPYCLIQCTVQYSRSSVTCPSRRGQCSTHYTVCLSVHFTLYSVLECTLYTTQCA